MESTGSMFSRAVLVAAMVMATVFARAAAAQEEEYIDAACCQCGEWFKTEEEGVGFDDTYVGLCGTCGANYEVNYGSLEEAVTAKGDEVQELAAKARQKRGAYDDWINRNDAARDSIFGFNGSLAQVSVSMLGIAAAGAGGSSWKWVAKSSHGIQWTQTGMNLAQGHDLPEDWMNWAGLGTELFCTGPMLEASGDRVLQNAIKEAFATYEQTKDWQLLHTQLQRAASDRLALQNFTKGLGKYSKPMDHLGAFFDVVGCLQAASDMGNAIADWRLAWAECVRLAAELEELETRLVGLTHEMKCILAEIENRGNSGGGGGGNGAARHGPSFHPSHEDFTPFQDPPELEFPPLPEHDGPVPPESAMQRAGERIEALKVRIEEITQEIARDVLPNTLALVVIAQVGSERTPRLSSDSAPRRCPRLGRRRPMSLKSSSPCERSCRTSITKP